MNRFLKDALAVGIAYWAADYALDAWIVKSDAQDPTGFVMNAPGFGADDVARILVVASASAFALYTARKVL